MEGKMWEYLYFDNFFICLLISCVQNMCRVGVCSFWFKTFWFCWFTRVAEEAKILVQMLAGSWDQYLAALDVQLREKLVKKYGL